jgi:hypothetical protein
MVGTLEFDLRALRYVLTPTNCSLPGGFNREYHVVRRHALFDSFTRLPGPLPLPPPS